MWLRLRRNSTELRSTPGAIVEFPKDLHFGAATASHQVEGGDIHSDWWRFEREPGRVQCFGEFPKVVQDRKSDHWRQFPDDILRLRELGLSTYRFSVDWSRVEPEEGRFDREVLARYAEMCRVMRENGIRPLVTLFHWSSPDWIWDAGRSDKSGWYNPSIVTRFERFVTEVAGALAPWVDQFITLNEPNIFLYGGFAEGILCPGHQNADRDLFPVLRHLMQAHVAAAGAIRRQCPGALVGVAHHFCCVEPNSLWNPIHPVLAALTEYGFTWSIPDAFRNGKLLLITRSGRRLSATIPGLANSVDFLGMNYYERWHCQLGSWKTRQMIEVLHPHRTGKEIWPLEINSRRFVDLLRQAWRRYRLPILVTENGCSHPDDEFRVRFLKQHLMALGSAIQKHGVDIRGYYYWSLLDNQEWANGFATRMGLYAVDYLTAKRTLRPVGHAYREIVRTRQLASH